MSTQTVEKAFETRIEEILTTQSGWQTGSVAEWDKQLALFPQQIFSFLQQSQADLWDSMKKQHGTEFEPLLLKAIVAELDTKGTLHILRHGFKFYGKKFQIAFFKPAHAATPELLTRYQQNRLTVTRQVPCHPNDNSTLDMLLAVNGLPVATLELKNPGTGQTWRHAIEQYKRDRIPGAPLFQFKRRALVHFAADPNEVHMTTRLLGEKTFFLPFNRGSDPGNIGCGAGNPQHSSGYRTGYFWEETLQVDSFLNILGSFMFIEEKEKKIDDGKGGQKRIVEETMVFPRYHQLDSVRKILSVVRKEHSGKNYLIQHSAGSGKTKSISWLSHHLSNLHDENDTKVFDCVLVISDRQVLDTQLQNAVYQIEHAQGVVKPVNENSKQLAEALVDGTKIVITTLQKFPFVLKGLLHIAGAENADKASDSERNRAKEWERKIASRHYAVIVDEAHSSQSGDSARELKAILGVPLESEDGEEPTWEDGLNHVMQSRGRQANVSFFAFTATPKGKTLELFGRTGPSGKPEPFHLYSMRQAIEEGFILDVVKNYTTYSTYFKLAKAIEDDPKFPKQKGRRALTQFLTLHPHNLEQKTKIIIDHFQHKVQSLLGGRGKAMVVTSSRLHAVRYMRSFQRYLTENKITNIRPLVAFSGTVKDLENDAEYTEPGMNIDCMNGKSISEKQLPARFESSDYHILLVANKYQTGFDQPLLCAMYVDKRLDGVQAVQTLSRLNRKIPGKETPFVLDFVNKSDEIYAAFKPYYDVTSLQEIADPQKLELLKTELDKAQVYYKNEVEAFAQVFYKSPRRQIAKDHTAMQLHLQPAVDRFKAWGDEQKRMEFRDRLNGYVKLYSFLSQVMPYCDPELEKLYSFGRCLLPQLLLERDLGKVNLGDDVELQYYRLQRVFSGDIDLAQGDAEGIKGPTDVGTGKTKDEHSPLSELIYTLNERFGTDFSEEDRLFFAQIQEKARTDDDVIQLRLANTFDNFKVGLHKAINSMFLQRLHQNDDIVTRYMEDQTFHEIAFDFMAKAIYQAIPETSKN